MNENKKYKEFKVEDVFKIVTGSLIEPKNIIKGTIPRITATDNNNGIALFTDVSTSSKYRIYENFISVSFLGSVSYQKNKVSLDMKIHGLRPHNKDLNENIALFLVPLIKKFSSKYSYGYQLSTSVLKKQRLMLPVNDDLNPDWDFMEYYVKKLRERKYKEAVNFYENELLKNDQDYKVDFDNIKWQAFILEEVCNIENSTRLTKEDMVSGLRPFIGASDTNNGVTSFVSNINNSIDGNVLGINYNGSVCEGFYHPYKALFSDDVKRVSFKKGVNNEFTLQFLNTAISKQKEKYTYGYKFNSKRMKKQKILLPVNEKNDIDFELMEAYIRKIKYKKVSEVLAFFKEATNLALV